MPESRDAASVGSRENAVRRDTKLAESTGADDMSSAMDGKLHGG
jgi:hypothetical protein